MDYHYRSVKCTECGVDMSVGTTKRKAAVCQECRIRHYTENMASLISKSGPQYEANVKAIREYHERRRQGGTSSG